MVLKKFQTGPDQMGCEEACLVDVSLLLALAWCGMVESPPLPGALRRPSVERFLERGESR